MARMRKVVASLAGVAALLATALPAAGDQRSWVLPAADVAPGFPVGLGVGPDDVALVAFQQTPAPGRPEVRVATRQPGAAFVPGAVVSGADLVSVPRLVVGRGGTAAAVWQTFVSTSPGFGVLAIRAAIRPAGGAFQAPVTVGRSHTGSAELSDAAVGDDGTVAVVARVNDTPDPYALVATVRPPGGAFGAEQPIAVEPERAFEDVRVAVLADGTVAVAYTEYTSSDVVSIKVSLRPPGASGFSTPVAVSPATGHWSLPRIVAGPDGSATVAFSGADTGPGEVRASTRPPGGSFGPSTIIVSDPANLPLPSIAAGPDGTIAIGWRSRAGIGIRRRPPGGAFAAAVQLATTPMQYDALDLAVGPDGAVTAIWSERTAIGAPALVRSRTVPAAGGPTTATTLSSAGTSAHDPRVAVGSDGAAVAVWRGQTGPSTVVAQAAATEQDIACGPRVQVGRAIAEGDLVESPTGSGIWRAGPGDVVYVGGYELHPRAGGGLVVDTNRPEVRASGAGVEVLVDGRAVPLAVAMIPIGSSSSQILFNRDGTLMKSLFAFPVSGAARSTWQDGGRSSLLELEVELEELVRTVGTLSPQSSGVTGASAKLALQQANCKGASISSAEVAAEDISFVPTSMRTPRRFGVRNVLFRYERVNGVDTWTGQADLLLPLGRTAVDPDFSVGGKAVVSGRRLARAGISVDGINKRLAHGLFLQKVAGDLVLVPSLGLDVGIEATLGPVVRGKKLIRLGGGLKALAAATSACPTAPDPIAVVASGSIPIVEEAGVASIKIDGRWCWYPMAVAIEQSYEFEGVFGPVVNGQIPQPLAKITSSMRGLVGQLGIEAEGSAAITLPALGQLTGRALVSTRAAAGCAQLPFFEGGLVHTWQDSRNELFVGCDLGPWRQAAPVSAPASGRPGAPLRVRTAAAGTASVTVPAGLPFAAFAADGSTAPPAVVLTGPGGARVATASPPVAVAGRDLVVVPVAAERRTYVFVRAPRAGRWQVSVPGGEASRLAAAPGLADPAVRGAVGGKGLRRTLRYRVTPLAGQQVVFWERTADGVAQRLGVARRARGTIRFTPASSGQAARIEAIVTQAGLPRARVRVARFRAPLLRPQGLVARRAGAALRVAWRKDRRAAAYRVEVRAGRRLVARATTRATSLRVAKAPTGRLVVRLVALAPSSGPSPAALVRVAARRR